MALLCQHCPICGRFSNQGDTAEIDPAAIYIELYRIAGPPTLIAIPLFTFAGFILANGRTPKRLIIENQKEYNSCQNAAGFSPISLNY